MRPLKHFKWMTQTKAIQYRTLSLRIFIRFVHTYGMYICDLHQIYYLCLHHRYHGPYKQI